ncbi:MAG: long-chain-fatty-acid--CoA ligase [Actinomycetota bacterium]
MLVLGDIPRKHARLDPGRECLVCEDTRLTWAQLDERVNRLANGLAGLGVVHGTKVAVLAFNCHRYVETYYATSKLGAVTVPLNFRLSPDELAYVIDHSDAEVLLVGAEFAGVVDEIGDRLPQVKRYVTLGWRKEGWSDYEELVESSEAGEPDVAVDENDLCQLQYTGGTTGLPKGVMLTHRNYMTSAFGMGLANLFDPGDATLQVLPIFHTAWWPILVHHCAGGKGVIIKQFDFNEILSLIGRERITHMNMVPILFSWILDFPDLDKFDLSSIKNFTYAGAPMPADLMKRLIEKFGPIFQQGYGLTEAAPLATMLRAEDQCRLEGPPELTRRLTSAGREALVTEVHVVDEDDNDVAVGEIGEITVRGANIMKGYWKDPELTANALRNGFLHTGDLARVDEDGFIYIVDRKNDMIITGGENVYPFEVERVIYEHPAILEAAVVGMPDPKWGEAVTAAVAFKEGMSATEEELIAFVKERIAGYKAPKRVIIMDAVPKTALGKVLRREVREHLQEIDSQD